MKYLDLSVATRSEFGRGAMKRLRSKGQIPAVIYGNSGTTSLSMNEKAFKALLNTKGNSAALIHVKIDDKSEFLADIVDMQRDPITDKFIHVDFHEVVQSEKMTTVVPLEFFGESIGVKNNGGVLDIARHEINVRCFPADLPGSIRIDISTLDVGSIIHLSDINAPADVEVIGDPNMPVVSCNVVETTEVSAAQGEESAVEASAGAEAKPEKA